MSFRKKIVISLVVLIPVGFASKLYEGPYCLWVNGHLGGLFYEIFWCLMVALIWPKVNPWKIAGIVCLVTCLLEFTQLWHPAFLVPVRENFMGRTLIGHAFHWHDFPWYLIGSGLGGGLIVIIKRYSVAKLDEIK